MQFPEPAALPAKDSLLKSWLPRTLFEWKEACSFNNSRASQLLKRFSMHAIQYCTIKGYNNLFEWLHARRLEEWSLVKVQLILEFSTLWAWISALHLDVTKSPTKKTRLEKRLIWQRTYHWYFGSPLATLWNAVISCVPIERWHRYGPDFFYKHYRFCIEAGSPRGLIQFRSGSTSFCRLHIVSCEYFTKKESLTLTFQIIHV